MGRNSFTATGKAELFLGGRLDIDIFLFNFQGICDIFFHFVNVRRKLGGLRNDIRFF